MISFLKSWYPFQCLNTTYFMAPELFDDENEENHITNKIEVYAFAFTLLSMFTTNYKFKGRQRRSISQLISNIINGKRYEISELKKQRFYIHDVIIISLWLITSQSFWISYIENQAMIRVFCYSSRFGDQSTYKQQQLNI